MRSESNADRTTDLAGGFESVEIQRLFVIGRLGVSSFRPAAGPGVYA